MAYKELEAKIKDILAQMEARKEQGLPESKHLNHKYRELRRLRYEPREVVIEYLSNMHKSITPA